MSKGAGEVDILDTIEKASASKKKKKKDKDKKKSVEKSDVLKDVTSQLPDKVQKSRVTCKDTFKIQKSDVDINNIVALSKAVYVDDIHLTNPTILATQYIVILKDERWVTAHLTEKQYHELLKKGVGTGKHTYRVVDCGVFPTLSYGFYLNEIEGDLPTAKQIKEKDNDFKNNPTNFHNPPVKIEFKGELKASTEVSATIEDDDFDIDFEDELNEEETIITEDD